MSSGWTARGVRSAVLIAVLSGCFAASARSEETDSAHFEGRWRSLLGDQTIDIARCGASLCGHLVRADGTCGDRVLTAARLPDPDQPGRHAIIGDLALPARAVLKARLSLTPAAPGSPGGPANGPANLVILGNVGTVSLFSRSLPYQQMYSRTGDSLCVPRATS